MAEENTEGTRYALYDKTELRFVGPVVASRSKANDADRKVKGHEYEVREV